MQTAEAASRILSVISINTTTVYDITTMTESKHDYGADDAINIINKQLMKIGNGSKSV